VSREGVPGAVRHGDDRRWGRRSLAERSRDADGLGALSRLAHEDEHVAGAERGEPEVEQLGGVVHRRGDALGGQIGAGRVAGVVRAAHPRQDDPPAAGRGRRLAERVRACDRGGRSPPHGVGLARDLGDEWVRKVS
jgi:hypothetical protein